MYTNSRTIIIPVIASIVFIYGLFADIHLLRLITKPIPVLFLIWSLYTMRSSDRVLLGALIFSVLGDIILELPEHLPFALGLGSFLIAHIFFIRYFLKGETQKVWWPLIPIFLYCGSLLYFMIPNLGPLLLPVCIYVFVIAMMLWASSIYAYTHHQYLPLCGAILFAVSDSLIAINKFIVPFLMARYAIIITYWLAQYLICTRTSLKEKV
jgi:alkenylglycerophosphocholine/alkenylglycerophosphoethanolamine hydrolase